MKIRITSHGLQGSTKLLRQLLLVLALGCCAGRLQAQNVEHQIVASQFGEFQVPSVGNGFAFSPDSCQVSGGGKNFAAFTAGVAIKIVDSQPSQTEVVTPAAVFIASCAVSLPATFLHSSFYLTSGTGGLQEAILNGQVHGGPNTIILDSEWYSLINPRSAATVIASLVKGNANLGLVDVTQTPYVTYAWNGSQYVAQSAGGGGSFPSTPGIVYNTNTLSSMNATSSQLASALNSSPSTQLASALLPAATSTAPGVVMPDNSTVTVTNGVLSATAQAGGISSTPSVSQSITQPPGTTLRLNNVAASPINTVIYVDGITAAGIGQAPVPWASGMQYAQCQEISYSSGHYLEITAAGNNSTTPGTNSKIWYPITNGSVPTQLDCAFYLAAASIVSGTGTVASGTGAAINLGTNSPYYTNVGLTEPTVSAPGQSVVNIYGQGRSMTTIKQGTAKGDGLATLYQPPALTPYAFASFNWEGFTVDANFSAPAVVNIYGAMKFTLSDLYLVDATDGSDHEIELGNASDTLHGWTYEPNIDNVDLGTNQAFGSGAYATASISAGVPTFTIVNGGSGYSAADTQVILGGTSNYGRACSSAGTTTATITGGVITGITSTATGCVAPLYPIIFAGADVSYGFKFSNTTDAKQISNITDGGAGWIAGMYIAASDAALKIFNYHPEGVLNGAMILGSADFYSSQCDTVFQYCFNVQGAGTVNFHSPYFEWNNSHMTGSRDYYFANVSGTPGYSEPQAVDIENETCGNFAQQSGYAHFDSSAGVIDATVGAAAAALPIYVHVLNPQYCNQTGLGFSNQNASPMLVGQNIQMNDGAVGNNWNFNLGGGPVNGGSQTMTVTNPNTTTTSGLGAYTWNFFNNTPATASNNYGSPGIELSGNYWNGTASAQYGIKGQLTFASGANPLGTFTMAGSGTAPLGGHQFTWDAPVVLPNLSTATTQTAGDNSNKVATTAYVAANAGGGSASIPATSNVLKGTGSAGSATAAIPGTDYVTPSAGSIAGSAGSLSAPSALPNGTTATTQATGDNSTQLATDAFVLLNAGGRPTGAASGGLAGSYPSPTLAPLTSSTAAPLFAGLTGCATAGYVLSPQSGTCVPQGSGGAPSGAAGGALGGTYPNPALSSATSALISSRQAYVLEDYLSTADGHGGTDYGYAASNFCSTVGCNTFLQPVALKTTHAGTCAVYTPIIFPGPVQFDGASCAFIPQSTLGNSYVTLTGCSTTVGSTTVTCASTTGLAAGMAIGADITLGPENYIASVTNSTTFVLALPASRNFLGIETISSPTLNGIDSMADLATGQTVTGTGVPSSTTISSINYAANTITLSNNTTMGAVSPMDIFLASGTVISGLTLSAIVTTPVVSLVPCSGPCQSKSYVTNGTYGASLTNVTIKDPAYASGNPGRSIKGIQGVQVYGEDNVNITNLGVAGIAGSALVWGGYVPATSPGGAQAVRESWVHGLYAYQDGDILTGQACLSLMTGYGTGNTALDEDNTNGIQDMHCVYSDAEMVVIGSYLHPNSVNGPRLLTFYGENQMETGGARSNGFSATDTVRILAGGISVHFNGGGYSTPGFGKATFHISNGQGIETIGSDVAADGGAPETYNVSLTPGSTQVTFVSAGPNAGATFWPSSHWNNIGVQINDGGTCAPCYMYLANPSTNVGGTVVTLASPYTGSATSGTLTAAPGGYYFHVENTGTAQLKDMGGAHEASIAAIRTLLDLPNDAAAYMVGTGALTGITQVVSDFASGNVSNIAQGWDTSNLMLLPATPGTAAGNSGQLLFQDTYQNGSGQYVAGGVQEYSQGGSGTTAATYHFTQLAAGGGDFYDVVQPATGVGSGNVYHRVDTAATAGDAAYQVYNGLANYRWGLLGGSTSFCILDIHSSSTHDLCFSQSTTPTATFSGPVVLGSGSTVPTQAISTNNTNIATTAAVTSALVAYAPLASANIFTAAQTAAAFFPQTKSAGPYASWFDDFFSTANNALNQIGGTGATCLAANTYADANHPGNIVLNSNTTSGGGVTCGLQAASGAVVGANTSAGWTWETAVYVPVLPGTTAGAYQAGLSGSPNSSPWTNGIGFYLSSATATVNDWYIRYGSTATDCTIAATAATWTRLTMVNDGTNVHWYVNGTQCGTGVAIGSMPSNTMYAANWSAVTLTASTAVTMAVDYVDFQRSLSR